MSLLCIFAYFPLKPIILIIGRRGRNIDTESITKSLSSTGSQNLGDDGENYPPMDIVMHLVDLFFQHLNSVFPLVHRRTLKQAIRNGTVSKPLLWSVMGIGARYEYKKIWWDGCQSLVCGERYQPGGGVVQSVQEKRKWNLINRVACLL